MADTNREVNTEYETAIQRYENHQYDFVDDKDHDRVADMAHAYDSENVLVECPDGEDTKSKTSLVAYLRHLKTYARELELTEATSREYREVIQRVLNGNVENVKDSGLSENTVNVQIAALRAFLRVHTDSVADPGDLPDLDGEDTKIDPQDMFSREEILALRDACENLRDKALIDFLLYTGQRSTATRTLRIKDLDMDKGRFRLNSDSDALKGADDNGTWRDLLLSEATVRQWLQTGHPDPDNPDAVVFTALPSYARVDPEAPINSSTIGRICSDVAERAAKENPSIESKPTNPHAYRHNFVTIALRRGMDEAAIKHQIGHSASSNVMETTYAHLKDSDYIREARDSFNKEVEERPNELAPTVCPKCGSEPPEEAQVCHICGLEFSPGAEKLAEQADEEVRAGYKDIDSDDVDKLEKLQAIDDILEDPEVKDLLLERMKEEQAGR